MAKHPTWVCSSARRTRLHRDRTAAHASGSAGRTFPPRTCLQPVRPLRAVPADLSDVCRNAGRDVEPARPDRADPRGRRGAARPDEPRLHAPDERVPRLPGLRSGLPVRRASTASCSSRRARRSSARPLPSAGRWPGCGRSLLDRHVVRQPWSDARARAGSIAFYQRSGLQRFARCSGILRALGLADLERLAPTHVGAASSSRPVSASQPPARSARPPSCTPAASCTSRSPSGTRQRSACWRATASRSSFRATKAAAVRSPIHAGEMDRGRAMANRNIEAFERSGADVYVINAAGCGSALKEYGHLFADDPAWTSARARSPRSVRDIIEYLDEIGLAPGPRAAVRGRRRIRSRVISCTRSASPRRRAGCSRAIPGLELREMAESSLCCGSAGIYNVTQPEMSRPPWSGARSSTSLEVDPDILATANPGCALQIANRPARRRPDDRRQCTSCSSSTQPTRTADA